jgi:hypothetical protein
MIGPDDDKTAQETAVNAASRFAKWLACQTSAANI